MDLAGLKDLKLVLGVARWLEEVVELEVVAVEWCCGGRFGMNLRGGG